MPDKPAPCACPSPPRHAATCPVTADLWHGVAPSSPDPLAPFRALADQYAAKTTESLRNADASTLDEARAALPGIAAGWEGAEFLLRHILDDLDNSRTTPDNPATSDDIRRRDLARNAVGPALNAHGEWLPLSVREAVADAVLAVRDQELEQQRARVVTLEHVAAGNKRHAHLNAVDLERAEAAIDRVREIAQELITGGASWDGNEPGAGLRILAAIDRQDTPS